MKRLLLTLLGAAALVSTTRAGTVYERITLDEALSGQPFVMFSGGTIEFKPTGSSNTTPTLLWASSFNVGTANGVVGYAAAPDMVQTPAVLDRSYFGTAVEGYNRRPALFTFISTGEQGTINEKVYDLYYLKAKIQQTTDDEPVERWIGIGNTNNLIDASATQVTDASKYRLYIESAVTKWTDYKHGNVEVENTDVMRISSMSTPERAMTFFTNNSQRRIALSNGVYSADMDCRYPTLNDGTNKRYPVPYRAVPTAEKIFGVGNEDAYTMSLGLTQTIPAPKFVLKTISRDGADLETPYVVAGNAGVTYKYEIEIVQGVDVLSISADGTTFTGIGEGQAVVKVSLSDISAKHYDVADDFYITVNVSNYVPVTLTQVNDLSTLTVDDDFVLVSGRPFDNGMGFVAASAGNAGSGVMFPVSVLPGCEMLPADMTLSVTDLNTMRMFFMNNPAGEGRMAMRNTANADKKQILPEKNYAIGYKQNAGSVRVVPAVGGGYYVKAVKYSYHLGFFNGTPPAVNPPSVSYSTQVGQLTALDDTTKIIPTYFYKITPAAGAQIETVGALTLDEGQTANVEALLKAHAINGELTAVTGNTFAYEVLNTAGAAFAAGQAPVTVAADGTITVVKPGQARIKVTLSGDYARYFAVEPAYCDVIVRTPAYMFIDNVYEDKEIELYAGQNVTLPAATLKASAAGGDDLSGVEFTYILANDDYEPWYDAEGRPVVANDLFSVDPATGVVTTNKGAEGDAYIIPVMTAETEKYFALRGDSHHLVYHITVNAPMEATIDYETGNDNTSVNLPVGETTSVPTPVLTVGGEAVQGVTYIYTVIDPATGEPFAEGEAPIIVDADGNITIVEGMTGRAQIVVSLSDEDALIYNAAPITYEVNVYEPVFENYVRVTTTDELKVTGMEGVLLVSARQIGDLGYVSAKYQDLSTVPSSKAEATNPQGALTTFAPVALGVNELPAELVLNTLVSNELMPFGIDYVFNDVTITEKDAYRIMVPDGRYIYRNYKNGNGISLTDDIETCNWNNNPFWYNVSVEDGKFRIRTGNGIYLGFNNSGILTHGSDTDRVAIYAPYVEATVAAPADVTGPLSLSSIGTAQLPVPTFTTSGENPRVIDNVPFVYTVVDAEGNPVDDAALTVDADGNITGVKGGTAFVKVTVAAPYDKFFDLEPLIYEVNVAEPQPAVIGFEDGSVGGAISIAEGLEGQSVPTPALMGEDETAIAGITFKYEVIDPATGEPFAEGMAPIAVDEHGNITTLMPGNAQIKVSLSDEDALNYAAEPAVYDVTVTSSTVISGANGEENIEIQLGNGKEADLPSLKVEKVDPNTGHMVPVEGVTYTYEVINPATGEPYAEGEAPVTVDANGKVTATDVNGEAQIKVTTDIPGAEPLYIGVTVKDYNYVTLQRITDVSAVKSGAPVVFVSSLPLSGKGFVSPSVSTTSMGIATGTTGSMPPVSILPGMTELPDELVLTDEQTEALRIFAFESDGSAYGFRLVNSESGSGKYIRCEKTNCIRYLGSKVIEYVLTPNADGSYAPKCNGYYLNFKADGIMTSFPTKTVNTTGANIVFYSIVREEANIGFDNGSTAGSVNIPAGKTGESVPTPVLTDENDDPIEGVTFKYEVIDPATGEPFAAGQAPITVDENGNITTVEGKTGDAKVVVTLSDESGISYDADPIEYDVTVTSSTVITGANGEEEIDLQLGNGKSADLPAIKVETVDPATGDMVPVEGVTYTYEVINPATGEPYAEGDAPVSVDPATGKVTATDNSGEAQIKVTVNGTDAEPLYIDVAVKNYTYVTLHRITDVSAIEAGDPVVLVSSLPLSGKGFVSPSVSTTSMGIATGTTGNMPPVSVFPGMTTLPDEFVVTDEQADALRIFNFETDGNDYGFRLLNSESHVGNYIRSEKKDRIRYLDQQIIAYDLTPKAEGVYAPTMNNFYLTFNASGILTSFAESTANTTGAYIAIYSVRRQKVNASLEFENGTTRETVKIPDGAAGNTVPTPVLTDDNDEPIEGVTFKYEVIDPATGLPFAEGEAPVSVDPATGEITTLKEGDAKIVVSLSDESADIYGVETPIEYNVTVTPSTVITGVNGEDFVDMQLGNGKEADLPQIKLTTVENGEVKDVEDAVMKYEVINPATGEPYAEGEAPVTVDPATGTVTATDNSGEALIKVTVEGRDDVAPMYIDVNVDKYDYVKFELVNDLSTINDDDVVVFVSSKAVSGKGFVASSHHAEASGLNVGTTGNMAPISVVPGQSALPAVMELTTEKADSIRQFNVLTNGTHYGFYIIDRGQHVKAERTNRVRYHANEFISYQMVKVGPAQARAMYAQAAEAPAAWAPTSGNLTLGYNAAGVLTHGTTNNNIVMYKLSKPVSAELKSNLEGDSFTMDQQETKELPTPTLTVGDEVVKDVTYTYTVVDENGQPFAEGEAPISVSPDGTVTALTEGTAKVVVSLSDQDAELYDAQPLEYMFTVTDKISSVIDVETAANDDAMYFNLTGVRVNNPQPGIYIRVKGSTTTKVMIK